MVTQEEKLNRIAGRVPDEMIPMYRALLMVGYSPSEIAREGIRSLYRQMNIRNQEITA